MMNPSNPAMAASDRMPRGTVCLLEHLNEHLLVYILVRITDPIDRRSFRMVCRSFRELESMYRKRVQLLRAELLPRVLALFERLEELDLSLCAGMSDVHLLQVADSRLLHLSSVNLCRVGSFTDAGLLCLTSQCRSLLDLDLSYCSNVGDPGLVGLAQRNKLEKLRLTGCFRVSDSGLQFVASGCLSLQLLVLKGCVAVTDAGLGYVTSGCKALTVLDLSFMEITDDGVALVPELKALTSLKLTACNNVGDKSLEHLRTRCKSLKELDVSRCQGISVVNLENLPCLLHLNLSQCIQLTEEALTLFQWTRNLQSLKLEAIDIVSGLDHVAEQCKQLKELSVSKSRGVTDSRVASVITTCRELRKLDFTCCFDLTEKTLVSIATHCTGLTSLKMESCPMVTDNSLSLLLQNCCLLEELNVTDCNVADAGLATIGNCRLLQILKLAFCHTTDVGVSYVGAACSNLLELDLYRCRSVGDAGVPSIVNGCRKLQIFNLSYCLRITDASMRWIARLNKLYQLEIRGCNLVTSDGLRQVAAGCKRLVELDIKRCSRIEDTGVFALESLCPDLRQINVSYCPLSNDGLMALARLGCMQNMKLVHLKNVSMECFGNVLLNCGSLKKVKLLSHIKQSLPSGLVEELEKRGCRLRWMDKPDF